MLISPAKINKLYAYPYSHFSNLNIVSNPDLLYGSVS